MNNERSYAGPERRRHRMYVTLNTEYHFRGRRCVAVRDRNTGRWRLSHEVLQRELSGSVRFDRQGEARPGTEEPRVGESLFFGTQGRNVITSVLMAIERPEKSLVSCYP